MQCEQNNDVARYMLGLCHAPNSRATLAIFGLSLQDDQLSTAAAVSRRVKVTRGVGGEFYAEKPAVVVSGRWAHGLLSNKP